jgi:precorrin-6B methylase 2
MSFISDIKNASSLLIHGEWREFILRLQVFLGIIDLKIDNPDALPTERTHQYSNSGGHNLKKVLNSLHITPHDTIVDFGSGKGGALITFSMYPFKTITGVEIAPELVAITEENLKKLRISNVNVVVSDATDFTDLAGYNYFYFFNPFPGEIMKQVVQNIESSLNIKPRKIVIIYLNPEFHNVVIENSSFKKIDEYNHHVLRYYIYTNR